MKGHNTMEITKTKRDKFIFFLIVLQPIIDIITSISSYYGMAITIGSLSRALIMAGLVVYIFRYLFRYKRAMILPFAVSYAPILLMLIVNGLQKTPVAYFQEINFAIKTSYYLVMIHASIILLQQRIINKALLYQSAAVVSLIVGISYWLAIMTGTSIDSYRHGSVGFSGWFFSANELSVIVIVLLSLSLVYLWYEQRFRTWLAFILMVSMVPMIGTKTAFFGGLFIVLAGVLYVLFTFRFRIVREKSALFFLSIVVLFVCCIPLSPIFFNTKQMDYVTDVEHTEQVTDPNRTSGLVGKILSSRDIYLQQTKADYTEATNTRKLFGLGYAGDYTEAPKLIEMDFFDLFFGYGVIGSILLVMPLIYLITQLLKGIFPLNIRKFLLVLTLGLCLGIAFLAGHVLFAPSVMSYVTICILGLGMENVEVNKDGVT
ncbi:O-antigen ligase family protein [Virgibacillus dakarensis]|uniref:O-antigen ligase family protein n=1 Tax=Virgibacillus dakarensis TaxID=1917889 RepID=UPI001F43CD61|nr:O-antigen ligase family protein [Virgibacillus dakarensis]